ncbi:MAG TPA: efflux RND transporter periplasmic adaptor subunit [Acidobacteriaceae bacterium]|nr:efflux RND transporter periplasmic adaptor subunit [Acidobacteriaceae bacterium]
MQPDPNQQPHIGLDHQLAAKNVTPRQKGMRAVVWIVLLLLFAAGFFIVLRHHEATETAATGRRNAAGGTVAITTATAQKGNIGVYVDAIGTVTPVYTSSITSQVNGIVTEVHYTEGQLVQKGDPLIEIDSRPYEATLLQAKGILERDQGILAQAQMDLSRYQAAWARNAIPKQTLDDQEKLVAQVQGTVHNDEGTVQYDQIQVQYCHIVAPITGRVGLRLVDPGNVVQASGTAPLVVITQIQPITVVFTVAEGNLGQIETQLRKGAKLEVDALDRDQKQLAKGTLLTLDNQIDTTTGTVKGRAQFANADSSLFPNQFVNTRLLVNTLVGATLIPAAAVQHNGQAAFVYVIADDKAHLTPITVGVTNAQTDQVQGIQPGDVLATSSFDKLQDNTPISISNRPIPASTVGSNAP